MTELELIQTASPTATFVVVIGYVAINAIKAFKSNRNGSSSIESVKLHEKINNQVKECYEKFSNISGDIKTGTAQREDIKERLERIESKIDSLNNKN